MIPINRSNCRVNKKPILVEDKVSGTGHQTLPAAAHHKKAGAIDRQIGLDPCGIHRSLCKIAINRGDTNTKTHLIIQLWGRVRSEEHTSELQSRGHIVCRLLLEK